MFLDYSKLEFDASGAPEQPELVLQTKDGTNIGVIPCLYNLKFNIKYTEPSELTFDVPSEIDGKKNWIYERLTGYKVIYTKHYGVYITTNPSEESDGIMSVKHIKCYSIEQEMDARKLFLEEGTYKFYDSAMPEDTLIGRVLEIATGWSVGYISPTIAQRYRTFDSCNEYLLSFVHGDLSTKFRCVFVFEPYQRTINVYDVDESVGSIPIFLDFENLLQEVNVEELSEKIVTALQPYGADDLDIRDVNPIGTNWLYNLGYFIENGDISGVLANKWNTWIQEIKTSQESYRGLAALSASTTARILSVESIIADLNGELDSLVSQQSVTIQALALEVTEDGKNSQQALLDEINQKISNKEAEILDQKNLIESLKQLVDADNKLSYFSQMKSIVERLSIANYFSDEEYKILSHYLIEDEMTDDSFVATSVDSSTLGETIESSGGLISIIDSDITEIHVHGTTEKIMYTMAGGSFSFGGEIAAQGDIIRATLETNSDKQFTLSLYVGASVIGDKSIPSGTITISGELESLSSDIGEQVVDEVVSYKGTRLYFDTTSSSIYSTSNVSEYQKYSVQMELYEYAEKDLADAAYPSYEFTVNSSNFLFAKEFSPFRKALELGKNIYVHMGEELITPYIIEMEFDFENRTSFSLVFSNKFKRHDNCNTLKDLLDSSYSSSQKFDASKYTYNQVAAQAPRVSEFMNSSLDASKNSILAANNQSVVINGAGINVGGNSKYQLRVVNSMIAMTDDNWTTSKLAIGLFASEEVGTYWGVNAEVVGGKLIVGNNLVIENKNDTGVMQFKVDSSGAWLNNSTFVLQKDDGGKIILDPSYGIMGGDTLLFSTSGTTVTPSFIDEDGSIIHDEYGMPQNSNFYLDINTGKAYFRGTVKAEAGMIGGFTIEDALLTSGGSAGHVALNGSQTNDYSLYAMWVGSESPTSAPFWIKKNGDLYAKNGTFSGTLSSAKVSGNLTATGDDDAWLIGCGIKAGQTSSTEKGYNFYVSPSGDVWMQGNLTLANGVIKWSNLAYSVTSRVEEATETAEKIANGEYNGTFIDGKKIISPDIYASGNGANYAHLSSTDFILYHEGNQKIALDYGSSGSYAALTLGNSSPGYIKKTMSSGYDHRLWLGDSGESNGIRVSLNGSGITFVSGGSSTTLSSILSRLSKVESQISSLTSE